MHGVLPLALFGLGMGLLMIGVARYQSARYRRSLPEHTAESAKFRDGQTRMIEQQERTIALAVRNAVALERIAAALNRDRA